KSSHAISVLQLHTTTSTRACSATWPTRCSAFSLHSPMLPLYSTSAAALVTAVSACDGVCPTAGCCASFPPCPCSSAAPCVVWTAASCVPTPPPCLSQKPASIWCFPVLPSSGARICHGCLQKWRVCCAPAAWHCSAPLVRPRCRNCARPGQKLTGIVTSTTLLLLLRCLLQHAEPVCRSNFTRKCCTSTTPH